MSELLIGYAPVSTDAQDLTAQRDALAALGVPAERVSARVLGEELSQGFPFRATWVGSDVREERILSAEELADLILALKLNEFTRYRVPART